MTRDGAIHRLVVRGTEIVPTDPIRIRLQKLARITLDAMVQFVGLLDAQGTVLEINKVALDAVGIERADVEGRPFWTTFWWQVSEEVNRTLRESIRRASQGEVIRWDAEIYGRAGGKETIIIDASLCPVLDDDGKVVFICAEGRDITERRAQEREIAQKNIALQGLLERIREPGAAPLEVRAATPDRPADSPASAAADDRPRVLVVEDNLDMNHLVTQCLSRHYDVVCAFDGRDGLEQALRFRPTVIVSDIMMPNVSGTEMIAELRKLPALQHTPVLLLSDKPDEDLMVKLLDNNGAQDFVVKPFSERELSARVRNLVLATQSREQMKRLRDAAEHANRTKDEFLAMLGHELRNPLSPILTALQLMKLRGNAGSDRERTIIERQVNHLARLVDDLLDVARIARGKVELQTEVVEIAEVVAKAIEMASPLLEQRTHALTVSVPKRGLRVDGDVMRLSQVISNLLTNAAKYTPPGGNISVRAYQANSELVLSVRDTGIGIAPDVLPRVFDLFVQERQALDRSQGGLGIGLSIVRSLIEGHRGTVSARSDGPGKGSEFIVRLPIVSQPHDLDEQAVAPSSALEANLRPSNGTRILVVDDNEDGAELLAMALTGRGYDTRVALDAPTALQVAAEFSPDIAFLDIGLPVIDGYALASQLRELPGLANLQLVAITGYGQESDRRRTREAGFHHHLVKPVDIETVEATVTRLDTRH